VIHRRWLAVWGWAGAILAGTSIPGSQLPPAFLHADKLAHLGLYGVFGLLVGRALLLGARTPRLAARLMVGVVAIAAFAAGDEWHQEFVPGRGADPIDWAADVVGAAAGLIVATTTLRTEQRI
jgi:VanZ family protein